MGINYAISKFRTDLQETVNSSGLPIEIVRMVLNDLLLEVNVLAQNQIALEKAEEETKQAEREEKENGIHQTDVGH